MTASIEWQLIDCYFIATIRLRQLRGLLQVGAGLVVDLHELDGCPPDLDEGDGNTLS